MDASTLASNVELLKAMNTVVKYMNDERAEVSWFVEVPDEADDYDFECFGQSDEEMHHVCRLFRSIVENFGDAGWFTKQNAPRSEVLVEYGARD